MSLLKVLFNSSSLRLSKQPHSLSFSIFKIDEALLQVMSEL